MKKVLVADELVVTAYDNFLRIYYPHGETPYRNFWNFVKLPGLSSIGRSSTKVNDWELPEETVHYIKLLASPHARTLAKAMEANGHNWKNVCGVDAYVP